MEGCAPDGIPWSMARTEMRITLTQGKVAAWERLIHTFGQRRQLPVLAKHVPTERPRLRNTAYEMVRMNNLSVLTRRPASTHATAD